MSVPNSGKIPTIGIIVTTLFDDYQRMIVSGIQREATHLGIRTVCFDAGLFDYSQYSRVPRFRVFSLVSPATIDGIIMIPGVLLWENREKELDEILRKCSGIPLVSIGIALAGVPSIIVDNGIGMNRLFDHLIRDHGSRRIAFVRGPECNNEAEERFLAYKDSLARYHIPYDPNLVFLGDFETWSGPNAVVHFCETKMVQFDTLVCSDDQNAIRAAQSLQKRGLRVPEDIRVTGFDDIDISKDCSPPLTTVHQPLFELGCMGLQYIHSLMSGNELPLVKTVPTHLVMRASCGCPMTDFGFRQNGSPADAAPVLDTVLADLREIFPLAWTSSQHEELLGGMESFVDLVRRFASNTGLERDACSLLQATIVAFEENGMATTLWHEILRKIFLAASRQAETDDQRKNLEQLWKSCLITLFTTEALSESRCHMAVNSEAVNLQFIGYRLSSCFTYEDMWKVLAVQLPLANVSGCWLSVCSEHKPAAIQHFSLDCALRGVSEKVEFSKSMLIAEGLDHSHPVSYCVVPLIIGQGPEGFVIFTVDIISRKYETISEQISSAMRAVFLLEQIHKQNLALRESENEDIRITLNSIGDAVIATDAAGRVVRMNTVAEKMSGWSSLEATNISLFKVLGITNRAELQKMEQSFTAILRSGQAGDSFKQISFTAKDGAEHLVNYSGAPIRNLDSSIVGVVLVIRDMTEQIRMEEQLRQTQKMESLGQLASGIAHDLNNMLTGISGNAQMMQQMAASPEYVTKSSKTILAITDSATELMRNLLAFSHKTRIQSAPVDVHECIGNVKNILDHSIGKEIEVVLDLKAGSTVVCGESALLQNVVLNLCLNARDAMPGGGKLTIATDNVMLDRIFCTNSPFDLAPGPYIAVRVKDTGMGMSPEVQKRIFEPFFTTKEIGKGTGLGLSAVYGIVKSHKGSVTVSSKLGLGTTFAVYLPTEETRPQAL